MQILSPTSTLLLAAAIEEARMQLHPDWDTLECKVQLIFRLQPLATHFTLFIGGRTNQARLRLAHCMLPSNFLCCVRISQARNDLDNDDAHGLKMCSAGMACVRVMPRILFLVKICALVLSCLLIRPRVHVH